MFNYLQFSRIDLKYGFMSLFGLMKKLKQIFLLRKLCYSIHTGNEVLKVHGVELLTKSPEFN